MLGGEFTRHRFIVLDFEGLTPAGRPNVPIEVAAVVLGVSGGQLVEIDRYTSLICPPDGVEVTPFDVAQTGLTPEVLRASRPAGAVMAELDALLTHPPYRIVAHHAATEANLIAHQRAHCPRLASLPLLDTVRLARRAYPELSSHRLDALLWLLDIPYPPDRHRAMPDVEATVKVFCRVLDEGANAGLWSSLHAIDQAAGRPPAVVTAPAAVQESLF